MGYGRCQATGAAREEIMNRRYTYRNDCPPWLDIICYFIRVIAWGSVIAFSLALGLY